MEEQRLDLTLFSEKIECLREEISKVIVGQDKAVDLVLTCLLANGHVLLEGVPGVAKTLLARLMARLVDAKFSRVQFTPDLMPSDVLGTIFSMSRIRSLSSMKVLCLLILYWWMKSTVHQQRLRQLFSR